MFSIENFISHVIVQKIGWVLLHFIWQAAAAGLFLAILLRIMRKFSSNLRYVVGCLTLLVTVSLPFITMQFIKVTPPPVLDGTSPVVEQVTSPVERTFKMPPARQTNIAVIQEEQALMRPQINWRQEVISFLEIRLSFIVTFWLLGVFALSIWHLGGYAQLQKLRRKMVKQVEASLYEKLKIITKKLGVNQTVQLLESALVQIPTVVGWLKPIILLPASALTGLNSEQLEAILAHELAHIKRFDYLVNIMQTIVEILGFYHPAVWWISHKIRIERENCCDDLAVSVCGDRINYAKALTSMEEIRGREQLAIAATGGNLFSRIRRLLGKDSSEKNALSWIPSVAVIILLISLAIPATIAFTSNKTDSGSNIKTDSADKIQESDINKPSILVELRFLEVTEKFLEEVRVKELLDKTKVPLKPSALIAELDDSQQAQLLKIVQDSNNSRILAAPKVLVHNNEQASIAQVERLPFVTGYTEPNNPNEKAYPVIEQRDVGLICTLTTKLSPDKQNFVMEIDLENSKLNGNEERIFNGKYKEMVPKIWQKNMQIKASIPDGKALLMGTGDAGPEEENQTGTLPEKKKLIILVKSSIAPPELTMNQNSTHSDTNIIVTPSQNTQPAKEQGRVEKSESESKVLIETQILHVSDAFLKQIGLDSNSLKNSSTWSKYRVKDSSYPDSFVIDSLSAELLLKAIQERRGDQFVARPKILINDGKQASINIKTEEFYLSKLDKAANPLIADNIRKIFEGLNAGTFLDVTPKIIQEKDIRLDMKLSIRDTVAPSAELKINGVIIQKGRTLKEKEDTSKEKLVAIPVFEKSLNASVPDGHSLLILGPEITGSTSREESRPLIALPLLDKLFRTNGRSKVIDEYTPLILIKTNIVSQ